MDVMLERTFADCVDSANALVASNEANLVTIMKSGDIDLIKPLKREIHLFDTYVAGTMSIMDKSTIATISSSDELTLLREESKFDTNAIRISKDGVKVGYVPERDSCVFARLMDAGKRLTCRVKDITEYGPMTKIQIGIYLIDF